MPIEQTSPFGPWPEGILPVHCFECRLPLCIGMPREEPPKRLVGTCIGCWAKYVIEWTADGTEALIGRLLDVQGGESPKASTHSNAGGARRCLRRSPASRLVE